MSLLLAVWPLCRVRSDLQDFIVMLLRKMMYRQDVDGRCGVWCLSGQHLQLVLRSCFLLRCCGLHVVLVLCVKSLCVDSMGHALRRLGSVSVGLFGCPRRLIATRGFLQLICQHLQDSPLPQPALDPAAASCSQASLSQRASLSSSKGVNLLQVRAAGRQCAICGLRAVHEKALQACRCQRRCAVQRDAQHRVACFTCGFLMWGAGADGSAAQGTEPAGACKGGPVRRHPAGKAASHCSRRMPCTIIRGQNSRSACRANMAGHTCADLACVQALQTVLPARL
jgi:hypothetical protein